MDTFFAILIWIFIIALIIKTIKGLGSGSIIKHQETIKLSPYVYNRKRNIMTSYEGKLFRRLEAISNENYYVFPQIHLSSLLNHQVKNGQDWRAALSKIQRKSVDFVLVDKETLETAYAIELDDSTHDNSISRWERDELVDEIMFDSGVPLVRLRNIGAMSDDQIKSKIITAKQRLDALS